MDPPTALADLLLMVDATGSMGAVLGGAKEYALTTAKNLKADFTPAIHFYTGIVCFRDPVDVPADVHEFLDFTEDDKAVADFLSTQKASGGGDYPEDWAGAFNVALTSLHWHKGSEKLILLLSDASGHGLLNWGWHYTEENPKIIKALQDIAKQQIRLGFIDVSGTGLKENETKSAMRIASKIYLDAGGICCTFDSIKVDGQMPGFAAGGPGVVPQIAGQIFRTAAISFHGAGGFSSTTGMSLVPPPDAATTETGYKAPFVTPSMQGTVLQGSDNIQTALYVNLQLPSNPYRNPTNEAPKGKLNPFLSVASSNPPVSFPTFLKPAPTPRTRIMHTSCFSSSSAIHTSRPSAGFTYTRTFRTYATSQRAGLVFPVARVRRQLRRSILNERIGVGASIYLAAVLEYLCAEMLDAASTVAHAEKKRRVDAKCIRNAIRQDDELAKLFAGVTIPLQ